MRIFKLTDDDFIAARKYRKLLLDFFDDCEDEEPESFIPFENELIADSDKECEQGSFETSTPIKKINYKAKKSRILQKDRVKCKECGKYISKSSVNSHKSLHKYKNLGRAFECPLCTFSHPFKSHITIHLKRTHKIENPDVKRINPTFSLHTKQIERIKCDKCSLMIAKSHMRNHIKFHTYKNARVKCKECKKFIAKSSVDSHKSNHKYRNLNRMYFCNFCSYEAVHRSMIKVHIVRMHGMKKEEIQNSEIKSKITKKK